MFGYPRERALGTPIDELIIPGPLREAHRNGLRRYLETRESRRSSAGGSSSPALHADGEEFPVELTLVALEEHEPPLLPRVHARPAQAPPGAAGERPPQPADGVPGPGRPGARPLARAGRDAARAGRAGRARAGRARGDRSARRRRTGPARGRRVARPGAGPRARADPARLTRSRSRPPIRWPPCCAPGSRCCSPSMDAEFLAGIATDPAPPRADAPDAVPQRDRRAADRPAPGARHAVAAADGRAARTTTATTWCSAEELARRAALALDNTRLFAVTRNLARTLQESLLPQGAAGDPPRPDRRRLPGRGRGAGARRRLLRRVRPREDGSWTVAIGDVCGKGPEAAAAHRAGPLHHPGAGRPAGRRGARAG